MRIVTWNCGGAFRKKHDAIERVYEPDVLIVQGVEPIEWPSDKLELFLPCRLGNGITLLAVWTKFANSPNFRYIGQLWKYLQINRQRLAESLPAVVIGDFNSNTCWDVWDRCWNHSDVVRELSELGIQSFYHEHFSEAQGQESRPTLYHQRKREKPYHVDYVFGSSGLLGANEMGVSVGTADRWLELSDHMPIAVEVAC